MDMGAEVTVSDDGFGSTSCYFPDGITMECSNQLSSDACDSYSTNGDESDD